MGLVNRILVPVDFSAGSDAALDLAIALAKHGAASVLLLHVWDPPVPGWAVEDFDALTTFSNTRGGVHMRDDLIRLEREGIKASACLEIGDRARAILRRAESAACDLIIVGAHDATRRSWLHGLHVSDRIVRNARCPVLVVHPSPRHVDLDQARKEDSYERDPQHPRS